MSSREKKKNHQMRFFPLKRITVQFGLYAQTGCTFSGKHSLV